MTIPEIPIALESAALVLLWLTSTPTRWLRSFLGIDGRRTSKTAFRAVMVELFNCAQCLGFWVGSTVAGFCSYELIPAILIGALTAFIAESMHRYYNKPIEL